MIKRLSLNLTGCAFAVAIMGMAAWCGAVYAQHGSLGFRCGLLAAASDSFLDGSNRLFQSCSWHRGNGTRTWGETYGLKVRRLYLSMEVRHTNPRITPGEAREEE